MLGILLFAPLVLFLLVKPTSDVKLYEKHFYNFQDFLAFQEADNDARK